MTAAMPQHARVVIVGAGPAGASAAVSLAEAGVPSLLLDDNPAAGGQIWRAPLGVSRAARAAAPDERGTMLRRRLKALSGRIDHRSGCEVVSLHPDRRTLWVADGEGGVAEIGYGAMLLCPGAVEVTAPVPGWTRPGVLGLGGLQILLKAAATVPAGPVVLGGAGPLLLLVGAQLAAAGVPVTVVDAARLPGPRTLLGMAGAPGLLAQGIGYRLSILRRRGRYLRRHAIVGIEGDGSDGAASAVLVAPLDRGGTPLPARKRRIPATVVGLGLGLRANTELTQLAGCRHEWEPLAGGWRPVRDATRATDVPGIFVAGDGAGIAGVDAAMADGLIAAAGIAEHLGLAAARDLEAQAAAASVEIARLQRFRRALASWTAPPEPLFHLADAATVICRCEDARLADVQDGLRLGLDQAGPLKMRTRAGMGLCQGRVCAPALQRLLAQSAGVAPGDVPMGTVRTPLRPVALGALAQLSPASR